MGIEYASVPIGSFMELAVETRVYYWQEILALPEAAKKMLAAVNTGASIRGICRSYNLPLVQSQRIALAVVKVAIGDIRLAQLAGWFSAKLPLPNDKAQRMAKEIEQDLFGPIRQELEAYWAKQKNDGAAKQAQMRVEGGGAKNVLNLKKENKPPVPPWR